MRRAGVRTSHSEPIVLEEAVVRLVTTGRMTVTGQVQAAQLDGRPAGYQCLADNRPAHQMSCPGTGVGRRHGQRSRPWSAAHPEG